MKTTLFDLCKTASAAAETAVGKPALEQRKIQLAAFADAGHDERDYVDWENYFNAATANFTNLQSRKAASTLADEALAKQPPKPLQA